MLIIANILCFVYHIFLFSLYLLIHFIVYLKNNKDNFHIRITKVLYNDIEVICIKVLVVDDDANIRKIIKEYASLEKYMIFESSDGINAVEIIEREKIDIIILDIMLPSMSGFDIAKRILERFDIPIIFLSAKSEVEDKLEGFASGAIDYMTKPFSPKELIARLKVIQPKKKSNTYSFDGVTIDTISKKIYIDQKEIKMTLKEYELLVYFVQNKNILLNRDTILDNVWGYEFDGTDRTIDTHIKMIRKKLGKYGRKIITIRGEGYRFE